MNQDISKLNGFEIEFNLKIAARNYRFQVKSAAGWIVAAIMILMKIGLYLMRDGP